jgi:uncharacterized protein involved in type VI secretion and phage assembly
MHAVVQTIRDIARHEAGQRWNTRLGVVKSVKGSGDYACTVELRETHLVLPDVPIATSAMGLASLPSEGDLVVVLFVGGDLHAPVVIGVLYNEKVAPPENDSNLLVGVRPGGETATDKRMEWSISTPGDGTRELHVLLDGKVKVEVTVNDEGIVLTAQDTKFTLKQTSGSDGKAELQVGNSKVTIEQAGNVTVEAEKTLTLKANKIELSADAQVKISGQAVDIN